MSQKAFAQKHVVRLGHAIYGTRDILARVQADPDSGDIACITWIGDSHTRPPWIEKSFPKTRLIHRTSELGIMWRMAHQGLGMAQIPFALGDPNPALQRIPGRYVEPGWGLWVLTHVDLRTTARVRIFKDILVAALEEQKDQIEGHLTEE